MASSRLSSGRLRPAFAPEWAAIATLALVDVISNFGFTTHFDGFTKGIIDPKDLMFFLSLIGFTLFLNVVALER
jgi:ABC-2 type transport system permease protein